MDLFVHPEGPRVRDRISHAEARTDTFPPWIAKTLLAACVELICSTTPARHLRSVPSTPKESGAASSAEPSLRGVPWMCKLYAPCFHPLSLLQRRALGSCWLMAAPAFGESNECEARALPERSELIHRCACEIPGSERFLELLCAELNGRNESGWLDEAKEHGIFSSPGTICSRSPAERAISVMRAWLAFERQDHLEQQQRPAEGEDHGVKGASAGLQPSNVLDDRSSDCESCFIQASRAWHARQGQLAGFDALERYRQLVDNVAVVAGERLQSNCRLLAPRGSSFVSCADCSATSGQSNTCFRRLAADGDQSCRSRKPLEIAALAAHRLPRPHLRLVALCSRSLELVDRMSVLLICGVAARCTRATCRGDSMSSKQVCE